MRLAGLTCSWWVESGNEWSLGMRLAGLTCSWWVESGNETSRAQDNQL